MNKMDFTDNTVMRKCRNNFIAVVTISGGARIQPVNYNLTGFIVYSLS